MTFDKRILWWGRHGNYGPDYPRNRTIMRCLQSMGHEVIEFQPHISWLGDIEAYGRSFSAIDLVWVPCFRQRDVAAAARWAIKKRVPLVFDPLISAYDKQVNEKKKYASDSIKAKRLLAWEKDRFSLADVLIADTECHKRYFTEQLGCDPDRVYVIPVSAEEALFYPAVKVPDLKPEVLFFGTFIGLQGPQYIVEAAKCYQGPPISLVFLGDGPERDACERSAGAVSNANVTIRFENWVTFHELPERIRQADICLGIFGTGEKSQRVIPNKVYQALACGKPVITLKSGAYPQQLLNPASFVAAQKGSDKIQQKSLDQAGIVFCQAGNPESLASMLQLLVESIRQGSYDTNAPRSTYDRFFSNDVIRRVLQEVLDASQNR